MFDDGDDEYERYYEPGPADELLLEYTKKMKTVWPQ